MSYRLQVLWGRLVLARRLRLTLPAEVGAVLSALEPQAWLVGGCVRDLLLGRQPRDWDVATVASPADVARRFARTIAFSHGTTLVVAGTARVEVTCLRGATLEEDLACRDFTINAMALSRAGRLVDPMRGLTDLAAGIIRACGDPAARFAEDPLRLLRAVRQAAELRCRLHPATRTAIRAQASRLSAVAPERIRDEFSRLVLSDWCIPGLEAARELGLLAAFAPELLEMVGVEQQSQYHKYPVWEHSLLALAHVPAVLRLRLAALLHDIGKPCCLTVDARGRHFYGHPEAGAQIADGLLARLRYDTGTRIAVTHLVRQHMNLRLDPLDSAGTVQRMVRRIGREYLDDLLLLWQADALATGRGGGDPAVPAAALKKRILAMAAERVPFGIRDLAINGEDIMQTLALPPGPAVGAALRWLLSEVEAGRAVNERQPLLGHLRTRYRVGS